MPKDENSLLFIELATLTEAGISIVQAMSKVHLPPKNRLLWAGVKSQLEQGKSLAKSLGESGLISRYELEIISVSEEAGRLPEGLKMIAETSTKRILRVKRLQSKLYLPFFVLVIAIAISSLLTLVKNPSIPVGMIILRAFLWLGVAIVITRMVLRFLKNDACTWLILAKKLAHTDWYKMQFAQVVFGALYWQIRSGIDFQAGFMRITKLINHKIIIKKLKKTSQLCGEGKSVYQSIQQAQLPLTQECLQILLVAEESGNWETTMKHYLDNQSELLEIKMNSLFEWAPRIYYSLTAVVAISVIL